MALSDDQLQPSLETIPVSALIDELKRAKNLPNNGKRRARVIEQNIETLRIIDLRVERAYQRNPNYPLIMAIRNDFDPIYAMLPLVIRRRYNGGELVIADAQQRVIAEGSLGYEQVKCVVIDCKRIEDEAEVFRRINIVRRRPPTPVIHRNDIIRRDPNAISLERVIREAGYHTAEKDGPLTIKGISHLHRAIASYGADFVQQGLIAYRTIWPEHNHVHLYVISGMTLVLAAYLNPEVPHYDATTQDKVDFGLMAERIARRFSTPKSFVDSIKHTVTHRIVKRRENDLHYGRAIVLAYNKGGFSKGIHGLVYNRVYQTYLYVNDVKPLDADAADRIQ